MTGILLDTHIWLWGLDGSPKLPAGLREQIDRSLDVLWLSPVSVWEVGLLHRGGRYDLGMPLRQWLQNAFTVLPAREAAVNNEVALVSEEIELASRDLADRFLAATALVYDLTLLTVDPRLVAAPNIPTQSA